MSVYRISKDGSTLVRKLTIRIFDLGNKRSKVTFITAGNHKAWNEDQVQAHLERIADTLDKEYPTEEFRMMELGAGRYNFIHNGHRQNFHEIISVESINGSLRILRLHCGHAFGSHNSELDVNHVVECPICKGA